VDPWTTISNGIHDILNKQQGSLSLASLHSAVGRIVSEPNSDKLRTGLKDILQERFRSWRTTLASLPEGSLITSFCSIYRDFQTYCSIIPKFYMLYDRHLDPSNTGNSKTRFFIRDWFKDSVLSDQTLIRATTTNVRKNIGNARAVTDPAELDNEAMVLSMYYSFRDEDPKLEIFKPFLEEFQTETDRYYEEFFTSKFARNSFPVFLQLASEQFEHEERILRDVLQKKEQEAVLTILHDKLLLSRESQFLPAPSTGEPPPIAAALTAADARPMKWLVDTYIRFESNLIDVYTACAKYVHNEMLKMAANFTADLKVPEIARAVGDLIDLTQSLAIPFSRAFRDVPKAADVLEGQIRTAWNTEAFSITTNFCNYIDHHIKGEYKGLLPEARASFPKTVAEFYQRLEDKKMFGEFYNVNMVRRFIKMQQKLPDYEFPVINAIRRAKTPDFAKPYLEYVKKVKEGADLEADFRQTLASQPGESRLAKVVFSPLLFDQRTFPLDKLDVHYLPKDLEELHKLFSSAYMTKHAKTKLMLLADVSQVECKFNVPRNAKSAQARTYTVSSDIPCASIMLLAFERTPEGGISLREIIDKIGDRNCVGQYLVRLCTQGCPITKRTAKGTKMADDDLFQLNSQFFFQATRVTIPPINSEKKVDLKVVKPKVDMDKSQAIKAAAVRVLKMKNRVEQEQLEKDVILSLVQHFRADVGMIRRALTELETEEYFTRQTQGPQTILVYTS
jgi:hypothetical protein